MITILPHLPGTLWGDDNNTATFAGNSLGDDNNAATFSSPRVRGETKRVNYSWKRRTCLLFSITVTL